MKNLVFAKLTLISNKEQRARVVNFHQKLTVITGENDTGKSVLIKSIYYTFGADVLFEQNWVAADVAGLLEFFLDGNKYKILRYGKTFAIFDDKDRLIWRGRGINKSLRPKLSEFLDFHLQLKRSVDGQYEIASPAFIFLPFYIDQDRGWTKPWESFERLGQYTKWKDDLIKYYTGIRPKEYYKLRQKIGTAEAEIAAIDEQLDLLQDARRQIERTRDPYVFDVDVETFQIEIQKLLSESQALYTKEKAYKRSLDKLKSDEIVLNEQITILQNVIKESNADFQFTKQLETFSVECPTCGTEFHNDFINRFSIADDIGVASRALEELHEKLKITREEIDKQMKKFMQNKEESEGLKRILAEKQGALSFKDVISSESHKEVKAIFDTRIQDVTAQKSRIVEFLEGINEQLGEFLDKKRIKTINDWYNDVMDQNLRLLHVSDILASDYQNLRASINKTGSDLPRALLAYYYSILATVCEYGTGFVMPAVIDSPNQQDQDDNNLKAILKFSLEKLPKQMQLILGTVEMHGVPLPEHRNIINLNEKGHLLLESEYPNVKSEFEQLLSLAMLE